LKDKTVYVAAADPAGDVPALAEALNAAKFVIVQDILPTATTALADLVLPAQAFTEREGTYTSAERRVQRFHPAVPARPGTAADFSLTAKIGALLGLDLEARSPLLVMNRMAEAEFAFSGISDARLAEVVEQFPIVGRADLYYGGTTYENKQGIGAHLGLDSRASGLSNHENSQAPGVSKLRPRENELLAVPVTKVYDLGTTMQPAALLAQRAGTPSVVLNPATAEKFGLADGDAAALSLNGAQAQVVARLDETVPAGVLLVYRSFGIPISAPATASLSVAEKA
jgi:NADH-quinone oxidoreductase subunit G